MLEAKKPLIVVVNENLMNNHQTELAEKLGRDGYLEYCFASTLIETIKKFDASTLKEFPAGNLEAFSEFIDSLFSKPKSPVKISQTEKTKAVLNTEMDKEEADYLR